MQRLRRDLKALSATAEEEFYEALSSGTPPTPGIGEAQRGEYLAMSEQGSEAHFLALHRAAFEGDVDEIGHLLPCLSLRQKIQLDPQGNTALHVAVIARQHAAIAALLDGGVPPDVKNERMWSPLDDAVALGDAEAAQMLYSRLLAAAKVAKRQKKEALAAVMTTGLPDFRMQLRWELGSPLFGLLLRHYAPDDTYTVCKVGKRLRVEGTLMGLDSRSRSLIPRWKRGHFSLLVDAGVSPTRAFLVDHTERVYYDLYQERKAHLKPIEQEVAEMIADGASKVRLADADLEFAPLKGWFGGAKKEKIDGWECEVYEASGSLATAIWHKTPVVLPPGAAFEEYLEMDLPADEIEEMSDGPGSSHHPAQEHAAPPASVPAPPQRAHPARVQVEAQPPAAPPTPPLPRAHVQAEALPAAPAPPVPPQLKQKQRWWRRTQSGGSASTSSVPASPHDSKRSAESIQFASASSASFGSSSSHSTAAAGSALEMPGSGASDGTAAAGSTLERPTSGVSSGGGAPGGGAPGGSAPGEAQRASGGKGRTFSSRCWLAKHYPITLAQMIPMLEVVSAGNSHFAAAAAYLRQFRSEEYFPVRVQVPLMWTVYLQLSFRHFALLKANDEAMQPGFFDLPPGYRMDRMEEGDLVEKRQQQLAAAALEAADPLVSLTNLLAAQQGLNVRVQEVLLLKQQLTAAQGGSPARGGGIRGTGPIANPLYKTELCRSWEETGSCRYGAKCQERRGAGSLAWFAHGREELRPVVRHPKYKTEVCRTFAQNGTCPYGTRCRFIHSSVPLMPAPPAMRAGSTTPTTGACTPPPPPPSRDPSASSLSSVAFGPTTPGTPPLPSGLLSYAPPPAPSPLASLGLGAQQLLGAGMDAASAAALLGLTGNGLSAGYGTAPSYPAASFGLGGASSNTLAGNLAGYGGGSGFVSGNGLGGSPAFCSLGAAPASPYAQAAGPFSQPAGGSGSAADSALAALAALLGASGVAPPPPPASPPPVLTAAQALQTLTSQACLAGSLSASSLLGVVGPPSGLPPIGNLGLSLGAAATPSCPTTPVGTPRTAMRRLSADSDASTPGAAAKRLPIFERLIPEGTAPGSSAASSARTSASVEGAAAGALAAVES
ncbi:Ankyrin repeat domain-containing 13C [Micractinium conductrix]|uniref:Ankyrin repeat domain-containing 13C n=1 Tax=Micractinium conductrix TaxID=554055 RepID=A0A2P6V1T0_9CHLO|nr:Ankyrin repeat domain-containing 13C [Micractinium conductrix]|eukprot:PSC68048.1 Ankyrin repeat domain-containing 13C [Micractinium conductrix]